MVWRAYEIVFRLCSPLHSGWRKVGNLQMTRSYVTGRMLWGALTMRLTRDRAGDQPAAGSRTYQEIGNQVNETLAFTYLYPALEEGGTYRVFWPWENERDFRRRFLGSYAGTALDYPQHSATEGSLHEVEFISPRTMDDGQPVYLSGYIFERKGCTLEWRSALHRLQLGGERGYGWGRVKLVQAPKEIAGNRLFEEEGSTVLTDSGERPLILIPRNGHLLAHAKADSVLPLQGEIEPLVGREWRSTNATNNYAGQHVEFTSICFTPGNQLTDRTSFRIGHLGVWEADT